MLRPRFSVPTRPPQHASLPALLIGATLALALAAPGCGSDSADGATVAEDTGADGTSVDVDTEAPPDVGEDAESPLDTDAADISPSDTPDGPAEEVGTDVEVAEPDVPLPPAPFATPWAGWLPAVTGDVLATVDAKMLRFQLVGGLPIEVTTFTADEKPTSPVALNEGLLCWDVNSNQTLDPAEDLDFDGKGTPADCALHPIPRPGRPGFLIAVNSPAGCSLRAYITSGILAWTRDFTGSCQQPTLIYPYALVASAAGATGVVRLVDARSGEPKSQITLAASPTTPAAYVGDGRYGVGLDGSVAVLAVSTGGGTGLALSGTIDTSPDRPTTLIRSGPSQLAAVVRGVGDEPQALGSAIRLFVTGDSLVELPFVLEPPGPIYASPISAFLGQKWYVAAAGTGWVRVFNPATGSTVRTVAIDGTCSALSWGGDGRVYGVAWDWDGNPDLRGGHHWTAFSFDPGLDDAPQIHEEGDVNLPIRSIASPAVLCDVAAAQIFLDGDVPSIYQVYKPCAGSLAPGGFARPRGGNGSTGLLATVPDCASGPGVVPCEATGGCSVNTDCDDNNACTVDSCVKETCSYKFLPGCCASDSQCDDFDSCTENRCVSGKCQYPAAASCCESASDCDDLNACTKDSCEDGNCEYSVDKNIAGCCTTDFDCIVNIPCVTGSCNPTSKTCQAIYTPNCCNIDAQCDDGNTCTKDSCVDGLCVFSPDPTQFGCCTTDADCNTGNACILGICNANTATCEITPLPNCCITSVQCDDKQPCTKDTCVDQVCSHTPDPTPKGCCDEDSDCAVEINACTLSYSCDKEAAKCFVEAKPCDDLNVCTKDYCEKGECKFDPIPGCCQKDDDCEDSSLCTAGACDPDVHICTQENVPGCCMVDADCNDGNPNTSESCVANACIVSKCEDHPFTTLKLPLDLVVVVDQSTSMTDEIPLVRTYLNNLATWLGGAGIDYRVTLVATRKKGSNAICIDPPLAGPNCENGERFRQIDVQVASHNALLLVMSEIGAIESFMRPDSSRQFVVFSDDTSDVSAAAFAFFLAGRPGYSNWAFHAFVGFDGKTCALQAGEDYLDLALFSGGVKYDICTTSWTNSYPQLGAVAENAGTSFSLSQQPLVGTVVVTYGGNPLVDGVGYSYDPSTNRVVLLDPLPATGQSVKICFKANLGQ